MAQAGLLGLCRTGRCLLLAVKGATPGMPTEWRFHVRTLFVVFSLLLAMAAPALAQLGLSFALPGLSIGINVPVYPQLVRVPGYPVYYAPGLQTNFFFYDGLYWVYQDDDWYASDWYDGPWGAVSPEAVPLFVLRIPVRYYRSPPSYFRDWQADAPPRWGQHWGKDWQQRRRGWDRWNRNAVPTAAPLPNYQRPYAAEHYPRPEEQQALRERNYRHQPREVVVRQHLQIRSAAQPERQRDRRPQRSPEPQAQRPSAEQHPRQPPPVAAPTRHPEAAQEQGRQAGKGQQQQPARKEQGKGRDDRDERGDRDSDRKK